MEKPKPEAEPAARGERLDSWKQIAGYLDRSVRTVRRWETEQGLPVHRQLHVRGHSVYGWSAELDAWLAERRTEPEPMRADEPVDLRGVLGRRVSVALGLVVLMALAALALIGLDDRPVGQSTAAGAEAGSATVIRNLAAAEALAVRSDRLDLARTSHELARAAADGMVLQPETRAALELFPARLAWLEGDAPGALGELRRLRRGLAGELAPDVLRSGGMLLIGLGRPQEAAAWLRDSSRLSAGSDLRAYPLWARRDGGGLEELFRNEPAVEDPFVALVMGRSGRMEQALETAERRGWASAAGILRGDHDLRAGRIDDARARFEAALHAAAPGTPLRFAAADALAMLEWQAGHTERSFGTLEEVERDRGLSAFGDATAFWVRCQERLADLYRQSAREAEAERIRLRLSGLLAAAESDVG